MSRFELPGVTLVAIDTRLPDLAIAAMVRSMSHIDFGAAVAFVPERYCSTQPAPAGIRLIAVDGIGSSQAYSDFVVKKLVDHVHTDHVLIVQWDGFVVHPFLWQGSFLEYDYIGAPWPQFSDGHQVGNGGFSLRSRRLMTVLQAARFSHVHPEDVAIGRTYRAILESEFGMRFPPVDLAAQFSVERQGNPQMAFGCHGLASMVAALGPSELDDFVSRLPQDVYLSTEARGFVKNLLHVHRPDLARKVLSHRTRLQGWSMASARLQCRIWGHAMRDLYRSIREN